MITLASLALPLCLLAAQPPQPTPPPATPPAAPPAAQAPELKPGESRRVGGDMDAKVTFRDGNYSFDKCLINTPLPEGYPAPTPPGAIDLKHYPLVRRAQIRSTAEPDLGMNLGFFPLFNHIQRRNIEMTSPVEMEFSDQPKPAANAEAPAKSSWTMSFLYRRPDQAPSGSDPADKRVEVVDNQPVVVLSVGMKGAYGSQRVQSGLESLRAWLAQHPEWKEAGPARSLYYNGPERPNRHKWLEVQVPVQPASPPGQG